MTRALLKFDKRKVAKSSPRTARVTRFNSTIAQPSQEELRAAAKKLREGNPAKRAKRAVKNKAYYSSAEWRAKRKLTFERDGYRCVEKIDGHPLLSIVGIPTAPMRCPNRGEVVNGKQTARGLVCEEKSYGHRGQPDRIDTCKTRCKDCDRRLTPLERANHVNGFRKSSSPKKHFGERAE